LKGDLLNEHSVFVLIKLFEQVCHVLKFFLSYSLSHNLEQRLKLFFQS
jgi:hypothetical protein